jgi:hypothetical protein
VSALIGLAALAAIIVVGVQIRLQRTQLHTQLAAQGFREGLESAPADQFVNLRKLVTSDLDFEPSQWSVRQRRRAGL